MALSLYDKVYYLGLALVIAGIAYLILRELRKFYNHQRIDRILDMVPLIPGGVPFLGHLLQLNHGRPWETICIHFPQQVKSMVVRFNMYRARVLLITEPPLIQRVLQTQQRKYQKDLNSFSAFMCLLGSGLVTSEGKKWRDGRATLSAAMRIEILEDLPQIAIECTNIMLKQMTQAGSFDLLRGFQKLTLQVIGRALLSLDPVECDEVFAKLYLPIVDECNARVWAPWKGYMFWREEYKSHAESLAKLNEYFVNLINKRWTERVAGQREAQNGVKQDILDLYMKEMEKDFLGATTTASSTISSTTAKEATSSSSSSSSAAAVAGIVPRTLNSTQVTQLRDNLKTMVLAGHETTAAMLTWTTYELLKPANREMLDKVRREHKKAYSNYNLKKAEYPPLSCLEEAPFTRACLREALRRYSVVPIIMRVAVEDDFVRKDESGLAYDLPIPKGTAICVGITSVHRNPTLWPDPESYQPNRFLALDHNMDAVQYSFIPFSAGPRHCLGQHISLTEAQFIVSYLLSNVEMELAPEASGMPHKYVVPVVPENGLPVKVTKASTIL